MQVNEIFFIGSNKYGQSGSGEKNNSKTFDIPKSYDLGIFIKQVSCGYHHSAVLTISGHIYTMGSNIHGTLGSRQEGLNYSFSPILVEGLPTISKIESGAFHLCALTEQGEVYSWGRGMDGQLGIGTNKNSCIPEKIVLDREIADLSCGTNHTILMTTDGVSYAFGNGIYGQLGTGNNKNQLKPIEIKLQGCVSMVAAGENHSLYLVDGCIYATGDNTSGQVGIGNSKKYVLDPQKIPQLKNVSIIQAAKFSACISDGELYAWGGSSKKFSPFLVQSNLSFTELKTGNETLMVLSSKGDLFSWHVTAQLPELTRCDLNSMTILDYSIGQNHTIILGDIVRTVEEVSEDHPPEKVLKCYETDKTQGLRDITKEVAKRQTSNHVHFEEKKPQLTQREKSVCRGAVNAQHRMSTETNNSKKSENEINRGISPRQIKPALKKPPKSRDTGEIGDRIELLLGQTKTCKKEFEVLCHLIRDIKSVSVDPSKNMLYLSKKNKENKENSSSVCSNQFSQKANILLLRQKDLKISGMQQQLSKKQALIDVYEHTVATLNKLLETQQQQLQTFEQYVLHN